MRGIVGPVFAMARPARPAAEAEAVRRAAELVRLETGLRAVQPVAREIAKRVVEQMLVDLHLDEFAALLAARTAPACPFRLLATCPEVATLDAFVGRRVTRMEARGGRYLSPGEQAVEQREISYEIERQLASRYARTITPSSE